mmetsp:Transcript_957/g.1722  ORF Transcript_957/g.1722 Transcript_957/m.1722 type:complete len:500 (-) Transcript_957:876-2375(-)|eukprot:CAMPEP_0196658964 /NCGR_PEP_ID=MMETSP1086-20130531/32499_1 /TAXON_ID=77921 /ORGANISM="Cyanoptyche  gloeocystis , Strain SAG4.97" /LENGTH=499 /DNA_ID=CAMNT_0041992765 /DNA_START=64 /DNA_END=1563 /DNA_ORIENTATION=-
MTTGEPTQNDMLSPVCEADKASPCDRVQPQVSLERSFHPSYIAQQKRISRLEMELKAALDELQKIRVEMSSIRRPDNEVVDIDQGPSRYWTQEEHRKFLEGIRRFGSKEVKAISQFIGSRNVTQVRTHAHKYWMKLERQKFQQSPRDSECASEAQQFMQDIPSTPYGHAYSESRPTPPREESPLGDAISSEDEQECVPRNKSSRYDRSSDVQIEAANTRKKRRKFTTSNILEAILQRHDAHTGRSCDSPASRECEAVDDFSPSVETGSPDFRKTRIRRTASRSSASSMTRSCSSKVQRSSGGTKLDLKAEETAARPALSQSNRASSHIEIKQEQGFELEIASSGPPNLFDLTDPDFTRWKPANRVRGVAPASPASKYSMYQTGDRQGPIAHEENAWNGMAVKVEHASQYQPGHLEMLDSGSFSEGADSSSLLSVPTQFQLDDLHDVLDMNLCNKRARMMYKEFDDGLSSWSGEIGMLSFPDWLSGEPSFDHDFLRCEPV